MSLTKDGTLGGRHSPGAGSLNGITCAELALAVAASTLDAALAPVVVCADLYRRSGRGEVSGDEPRHETGEGLQGGVLSLIADACQGGLDGGFFLFGVEITARCPMWRLRHGRFGREAAAPLGCAPWQEPFAKRLLAIDGLPADNGSRRALPSGRPAAERGHRHAEPCRRRALV